MKIPRFSTDFHWLSALRRLSLGRIIFPKRTARKSLCEKFQTENWKKSPFLSIFCLPSDGFCNFWSTKNYASDLNFFLKEAQVFK